MRRYVLPILAILSLALLSMLLSSYVGYYGFTIGHLDTSRRSRVCRLFLNTGLIEYQYNAGVYPEPIQHGWYYHAYRWPPASFRKVRDNLWTFHAGPMWPPIRYNLAFPAWLPALACTIAPLLWLRRRRRTNRRGFAIEPSEPSHLADATAAQE